MKGILNNSTGWSGDEGFKTRSKIGPISTAIMACAAPASAIRTTERVSGDQYGLTKPNNLFRSFMPVPLAFRWQRLPNAKECSEYHSCRPALHSQYATAPKRRGLKIRRA